MGEDVGFGGEERWEVIRTGHKQCLNSHVDSIQFCHLMQQNKYLEESLGIFGGSYAPSFTVVRGGSYDVFSSIVVKSNILNVNTFQIIPCMVKRCL